MATPEKEEYQESLSEWRNRLKASIAQQDGGQGRAQTSEDGDATAHRDTQIPPPRQPLIDQVSNKWRDEKTPRTEYEILDENDFPGFCDLDDEGSCPNTVIAFVRSRRGRRMLVYTALVGIALLYLYQRYVRPAYKEDWAMREGFIRQENGTYGIARGGKFEHGEIRIQELDKKLMPGGEGDVEGKRRLVFVGDIHGCKDDLLALLDKVGFNEKTDHLIATGDVISKGPDNSAVLDELIRLKATSVRGNHEDRILTLKKSVLNTNTPAAQWAETSSSKGASKDATLIKHLKPHHFTYLHHMPLILRIPALPQALKPSTKPSSPIAEEILVVHAGLVPHMPLEKQDPYFVMNMRSLHPKSHVPSSEHAHPSKKSGKHNRPWIDVWNWYGEHLFRNRSLKGWWGFDAKAQRGEDAEGWLEKVWMSEEWSWSGYRSMGRPKPQVVVYGHDSKAGLRLKRWTKGLDSGCVSGGALTAMVLDARGGTDIVSVECEGDT